MLRRADNKKWAMPGGTLEFGENLLQCALREVREECGLEALITDILGAYTDPNVKVAYSDGEVRQEFTIVYTGEVAGGNLKMDGESTACRWIRMEDMDVLPMAESQRKRIEDVKRYLIDGTKHFS